MNLLGGRSRHIALLLGLVFLSLFFGSQSEAFRDPANLLDRTRIWTEIGLIAIPMTLIIIAGGIDLSVGSLLALSVMVVGIAAKSMGLPLPAALGLGVVAGLLGGFTNGFVISKLKVPALVATLGSMAMFRGIAMGAANGQPLSGFDAGLVEWGGLAVVGRGQYAIPQQFLLLLAFVIAGELLLQKTPLGRQIFHLGENETAARFAGIPISRVKMFLFGLMGLIIGVASVLYLSRSATANPSANAGWELQVIACCVIGGTRITGGNGSVVGTFLGLLLLAVLEFGLEMKGVPQQVQTVLVGGIVVVVAVLNEWVSRLAERSESRSSSREPKVGAKI